MGKLVLILVVCFGLAVGVDASTVIALPLNSPVFVSLTTDPVVTVGSRTIDFTANLNSNQQFYNFLFVNTDVSNLYGVQTYRETIAIGARDGLALLGGAFPASPDPNFANTIPAFTAGTTDLILFDFVIGGQGTAFSLTLTDINGVTRIAGLSTPTPEPGTILLSGAAFLLFYALHRKRVSLWGPV